MPESQEEVFTDIPTVEVDDDKNHDNDREENGDGDDTGE